MRIRFSRKRTVRLRRKNNTASEQAVKSGEDKLSSKAKNYLDNIRKTYGHYDFIVADAGDDRRALLDKSDKEFSVIVSYGKMEVKTWQFICMEM